MTCSQKKKAEIGLTQQKVKKDRIANIFEAGSATIVEAKRRGLTHELLAVANNFAWADNGPVLHIPVARQKRSQLMENELQNLAPPGPMRFLHPYDLKPHDVPEEKDDALAWQKVGDTRFRRVLMRQEEFNGIGKLDSEDHELQNMAGTPIDSAALEFVASLDPIARIRRRAADTADNYNTTRKLLLTLMFWLIIFAANFLGAYEHWHHKDAPKHESHPSDFFPADLMSLTQGGLLAAAILCLSICGFVYYRYIRSGREANRFDYRAIGEALRVQFYWKLAGTGRSVSADYMQRQRDELDWIRYVVSSISMPHESARQDFLKLPRTCQINLLTATRARWIVKQIGYFAKATKNRENAAHHWHGSGWTLAAAGLLSLATMLGATLFLPFAELLHEDPWQVVQPPIILGAVLLVYHLATYWYKRLKNLDSATHGSGEEQTEGVIKASRRSGFLSWVFGKPLTWGCALLLAAMISLCSHSLESKPETPLAHETAHMKEDQSALHPEPKYWPDGHNLWIILTGAALLGGAMCVAWAERNFYAEEARQYRAMGNLFTCADRRLDDLIKRYEGSTGAVADRILFEIHDILHQLGCEALDENAEWLIQHRARPLEMPMAG